MSGNFDRRGGTLMGKPVVEFPDTTREAKYSRIENTPYITSGIPTGILADEILTSGDGQVKALFVIAGNPMLACANSERLGNAFEQLDLLVSIDLYRNETAGLADYSLPGLHFLERPDVPFFFITAMGLMPNRPGDYFGTGGSSGRIAATESKKMQLAPVEFMARAQQLDAVFEQELATPGLKLISKRERYSHNSWTHNGSSFVKGPRNSNYLYIHPDDARQRRLTEGSLAEVCANGQCISVPVKLDSDFMPGTVAVPHGWGHQQAEGLSIASTTRGANVNILASDGPGSIEPVSGMSPLNGIPVVVRAVSRMIPETH